MNRVVGSWGRSLSIRMSEELKKIGAEEGTEVKVVVKDNKIIIEKVEGK